MDESRNLNDEEIIEQIKKWQLRFEKNMHRHQGLDWAIVLMKLKADPEKLKALAAMENSGGEPDVVSFDTKPDSIAFVDCSPETPAGRRSLCYDREALESRKENKPVNSALDFATEMGIGILNEEQYRALQKTGNFDTKTSSWIKTPEDIRKRGGALFAEFRYGHVFVFHNSAPSYYAVRGFRGVLTL